MMGLLLGLTPMMAHAQYENGEGPVFPSVPAAPPATPEDLCAGRSYVGTNTITGDFEWKSDWGSGYPLADWQTLVAGDIGAGNQYPPVMALTGTPRGFRRNISPWAPPAIGNFLPPSGTIGGTSVALLPPNSADLPTGWQGITRPTLHQGVDLVTGLPTVQVTDLELPFAGSSFRLIRTRAYERPESRKAFRSSDWDYPSSDNWWDWSGWGWMASENPILVVDAATADSIGVHPRTCWLVLDAHHSIPFQQIENTGQYEAPPRFRAQMTHNGTMITDINGKRVWSPAPTQYKVSLYDGELTYTFVVIREGVPPKAFDDDNNDTTPAVLASYQDRPALPDYFHGTSDTRKDNTLLPYSTDDSPGFGLPHYAICVRIEDRYGHIADISYCDVVRRPADDANTTDCVECINDAAAIGQISRITLRHNDDVHWTLVYVHRRFFPDFGLSTWLNPYDLDGTNPTSWLPQQYNVNNPDHAFLFDSHGQVAMDRIYVYAGEPYLDEVDKNLTIHHLDKPYHTSAIDPEVEFDLPDTWAYTVRYHYDYFEAGGDGSGYDDGLGRARLERPLSIPLLLRTEVTARDSAPSGPPIDSTQNTVFRYDVPLAFGLDETVPMPWLEMVLTDDDIQRIMAAKLPPSSSLPPQPDDLPADIHTHLPDAMTVNDLARGGMWNGSNRGDFVDSQWLAIRRFASFLATQGMFGFDVNSSDHPSDGSLLASGSHGQYVPLERERLVDDSNGTGTVNALSIRDASGQQRFYRVHHLMQAPGRPSPSEPTWLEVCNLVPEDEDTICSNLYGNSAAFPMRSITTHPFQWIAYGNEADATYGGAMRLDQALWISIIDEFDSLDAMLSTSWYDEDGLKEGQISRRVAEVNPAGFMLRDRKWEFTPDGVVSSGQGLGEEFVYLTVEDYFATTSGGGDDLPAASGRPDLAVVRSDLLLAEWRSVGWSSVSPNPQEPNETAGLTRFSEYEQFGGWGAPGTSGGSDFPYSARVQLVREGVRRGTSFVGNVASSNTNPKLYQRQLFRDEDVPGDILCEVTFLTPATSPTTKPSATPQNGSYNFTYRATWFETERDQTQTQWEEWDRSITARTTITTPRQTRPGSDWYYPIEREVYDDNGCPVWSVSGQLLAPLNGAPSSPDPDERLTFTYFNRSPAGYLEYSVVDAGAEASINSRAHGGTLTTEAFPPGWTRIGDTDPANYATEYLYSQKLGLTDVFFPNGRRWARRVILIPVDTDGDTIDDDAFAREYTFNDLEQDGVGTNPAFRAWSPGEVKDYLGREPRGGLRSSERVRYATPEDPNPIILSLLDANNEPDFEPLTKAVFKPDGNGRMAAAELLEADPDGALLAVGTKERNDLGEVIREREIDGSITRMTRNALGQHLRTYVGTRDYTWVDPEPADPENYNMILVERTEYGGGVTDAWLPTVVRRYDANPTWALQHYETVDAGDDTDSFATVTSYDWRMRPVRIDSYDRGAYDPEHSVTATRLTTTLTFLDHLDRPTLVVSYGTAIPTLSTELDPTALLDNADLPAAREFFLLSPKPIAISETIYSPEGIAAEQRTYDMAWTPGTDPDEIPAFHATYQYAGHGGQIVYAQRPGQPIQITRLDGVGRVFETKSILPGSLAEHSSTPDGYVLAKTKYNYDADGNGIDIERWERVLDDTAPNEMPELDDSNAVRSRSVSWYDPQKRLVAAAELGTEQATYTYGEPDYERVPGRNIPVVTVGSSGMAVNWQNNDVPTGMVSLYHFDEEGNQTHTMDPAGRVTEFVYSGSGRVVEKIENRFGSTGMSRSTKYVHQYGRVVQMIANPTGSSGEEQVTEVHYAGAEIVDADFNVVSESNALVRELEFPPTGGSDANTKIQYRYTFSGQIAERIDSRGVAFRYFYDALGRTTEIKVGWYDGATFTAGYPASMTTSYGAPADRVARVTYEYDIAGNVSKVKAFNEADQYVTSTAFDHDANGNLLADKQAIGNDVVTNTPKTVYTWEYEPTDALNGVPGHIRPLTVKYPVHPGPGPSGTRSLSFQYGASDSIDDRLGRLSRIQTRLGTSGSWSDLTTFEYVGVSRRASLSYGGGTSTTGGIVTQSYRLGTEDVGIGCLDGFGRVRDLHFKNSVNETLFRAQYRHDILGNRVTSLLTQSSSTGPVENAFSQLNAYDELNRLVGTQMGELEWNTSGVPEIATGTVFRTDEWKLDLLGNWRDISSSPTGGRLSTGSLDGYGTPWARPWADSGDDTQEFIFGVNDLNQYTSIEIDGDATVPFDSDTQYDAAGNMVSDGRYYYQYDAWNRVVQINHLAEVESFGGGGITPIEPGLLVKHYTYDGVGRMVRTQSPFPSPEDSTGEVRSERFYYDGIRRIQELVIDPVLSLGEALTSGDPELELLAGQLSSQSGEPLDPSTTPGELEETQIQNLEDPGNPIPTSATLAREYVWGPGDNGLDELLVQFGTDRKRWWVIQDAGGDVVAICDVGTGSSPVADVAGQWVYDAYGEVLLADHLLPFPQMHLGHKGIFLDRLDVAVVDSSVNESPRLVPFGHTICHNRNRLYSPQLGRFFQLDPNATAMALLEASVYHGRGVGALALAFSVEDMYGDGMNLYEYLGSNPWNRSDPLGLSWDPFDMVDEFLAEDAGSKAAFMQAIGMSAKATAVLAATIASYLPIPGLASAGDLALYALGEQGAGATAVALGMGIIPGGKLAKLFATSKIGKLLGGIGSAAWGVAKGYATKAGAILLSGARRMVGGAANLLGRATRWVLDRKPAAACGCFAAGSLVWTTFGQMPIEDVRIGDQVITLNESTGAVEIQPVIDVIVTEKTSLLRMAVIHESGRREVIDTTDEHPFYEESRVSGWTRADSLSPGDVVRTMGGAAVIDSLSYGNQRVTVYNLTVANAHTYLVGDEAAWVHNMECVHDFTWGASHAKGWMEDGVLRAKVMFFDNALEMEVIAREMRAWGARQGAQGARLSTGKVVNDELLQNLSKRSTILGGRIQKTGDRTFDIVWDSIE